MRALLLSLILLLATTINCYASNTVYITQIGQTGQTIFIKQEMFGNKLFLIKVKEKITLAKVINITKQEMLLFHQSLIIAGH